MRNRTEHGFSRLTAISDAGSTPAASTRPRPCELGGICPEAYAHEGGLHDLLIFGLFLGIYLSAGQHFRTPALLVSFARSTRAIATVPNAP